MNATQDAAPITLEPIRLDELKPATKDFPLALSLQSDKSAKDVIEAVLDEAANRSGFTPKQAA